MDIRGVDLKDKYVVIKGDDFVVERVFLCTGGFGCSPTAIGRAVFGNQVALSPETVRIDRSDIKRFASKEEVAEAKAYYKEHGYEPLCKRAEKDMKLLLSIAQTYCCVLRLLKNKKGNSYALYRYEKSTPGYKWSRAVLASASMLEPLVVRMQKELS